MTKHLRKTHKIYDEFKNKSIYPIWVTFAIAEYLNNNPKMYSLLKRQDKTMKKHEKIIKKYTDFCLNTYYDNL